MSDMKWYSVTSVEVNLVNEPYEARLRRERVRTGVVCFRHGKWALQLKGVKRWDRTWTFNTLTMEMKPAK